RSLDLVPAVGPDKAGGLLAIDEELRGAARTVIGRHREIYVLPAIPVDVAQFRETSEPAIRGNQRVRGQAAGGGEQAGLGVAVPVGLAELEALAPGLVGQREDVVVHAAQGADLGA